MFEIVRLPRGTLDYPITIAELRGFTKQVSALLTEAELVSLTDYIALHPECGAVIPGTGGVRKLRWSGLGKGKSKGLRIIYFYHDLNMPVYLLAAYSKGEALRLTKREEQLMSHLVDELTREHLSRRMGGHVLGSSA